MVVADDDDDVVEEAVEEDDMIAVVIVVAPTLGFVPLAALSLVITADVFLTGPATGPATAPPPAPTTSADGDSPSDTLSSLRAAAALASDAASLRTTDSSLLDDRILSRSSPLRVDGKGEVSAIGSMCHLPFDLLDS